MQIQKSPTDAQFLADLKSKISNPGWDDVYYISDLGIFIPCTVAIHDDSTEFPEEIFFKKALFCQRYKLVGAPTTWYKCSHDGVKLAEYVNTLPTQLANFYRPATTVTFYSGNHKLLDAPLICQRPEWMGSKFQFVDEFADYTLLSLYSESETLQVLV